MEKTLCLPMVAGLSSETVSMMKSLRGLTAAEKTVVEFSGIMANPTYTKVLGVQPLQKKKVSISFSVLAVVL